MPKADRILANLPPTFRLRGDPSALRALVDAYGGELQQAENSLVAVMRAHWVQFADAGEPRIEDLALFAALYGLAPRPDESVEEFRDHLRRYVRTHLEGTVTVRGILRITAEALGLHIEDDALDAWWDRAEPVLVTTAALGADAASLVLGAGAAVADGADAAPARLVGDVDLGLGVDLRARSILWVALDGHGALPVDLTTGAGDPALVTPAELVAAIDAELGVAGVAAAVGGRLTLTSTTTGVASQVAVEDGPGDAADLVLGLAPRSYAGTDATRARLTGTADLSTALDLTGERYLRLAVDGAHLVEVDCAVLAPDPAAVDVGDVTDAINAALGFDAATDDGRFLTLASPTLGPAGSIVLLDPAAQPATARLFGDAPRAAVGAAARRASVASDRGIGQGVDLTGDSLLRIAVDAEPAVTVDIAGLAPAATTPAEIVASVNEGLGATVASHDGDRITLASTTAGAAGLVRVEEVAGDAAEAVLGLRPRSARGAAPVTAALTGQVDLSAGVDLSARHLLVLAVDGAAPVEVDLRAGVADPTHASVEEVAAAVNAALGSDDPADDPVATDDGAHLILVSTAAGAAGRLEVAPLRRTLRRRFVTRARVTDDAATKVLGFTARSAAGAPAQAALLAGGTDLSGGADLTTDRYLRLRIGDAEPVEIDCAGPRPRATTPAEIVARIVAAAGPVATTDGHTIVLTDPEPGGASRVALEPPRACDALDRVLGLTPRTARGDGAAGVRFTGTVDLSAGVELVADAALRIGVDGAAPVDVPVGDGVATAVRPLSQLVARINLALAAPVAAHDSTHLLLVAPTTGAGASLTFEAPSVGTDATATLLGIAPPRTYAGRGATAARLTGVVDLTAGADLRVANLLTLAVDGAAPVIVDLTAAVAPADHGAVPAAQVAAAINAATTAAAVTVAIPGGLAVQVTSPSSGPSSRLDVARTGAGDAAPLLFGAAGLVATGADPAPAVIDGTVDLLGPVDLGERSILRLAVDGGEPVDVDVAGVTASATLLGEVVAAIDRVLPGVAQVGPAQRLRLVSRDAGADARVEVVPVRQLEVVEYPPTTAAAGFDVRHGSVLLFANAGAAAVPGRVELTTAAGVAGPRLADPAAGWSVRVDEPVVAGGRLVLEPAAAGGVTATLVTDGVARVLAPELVHVAPAPGAGADGTRALTVRRGRNRWSFTQCRAARFDEAVFDTDRFAGGACTEEAVFDLSRLGPAETPAVFAAAATHAATAHVAVTWDAHEAGAFEVSLPRELDVRFGVELGQARFGAAEPELLPGVVTEPLTDDQHVVTRINTGSRLIEARLAPAVPIGWAPVALPFRDPAPLTLGRPDAEARLYVSGPGLAPGFLELRAAEVGAYGNEITVTARVAGPAIYDLEVRLPGGRFENARAVVFGPPLPTLADDLLAPRPVGVGTAKAAGIRAHVTRDRAVPAVTHETGLRP
ncbi:hypothetical protein [Pengzhenrongella sicca]|uniref:Uncharacterized protein n=1 Tax=Pengzhenrongella sicca TaxID=2819238 RepID=A0A8A4Z9Q4_9MICO|nr:hypothetical protein [Pengzhenrongella sicca]QTE27769.1 hypothetical protein J4E96_09995 [Pengzhenrongella sicca]